jgi:cytochrome b561
MAAMVLAHIGAALFHHFIRKDRVLMRMIGGG